MIGVRIDVDTSGLNLNPAILDGPVAIFLTAAAIEVQSQSRGFAPVDTGRLRSSIAYTVSAREAAIGPNVHYGPYMEFGTSHSRMPPPQALEGWASRHGLTGWGVALGILMRGGLEERRYMRDGLEASMAKIRALCHDLARAIARAI